MTEPDPGDLPVIDGDAPAPPLPPEPPSRRRRALPALAVASMLVAGGLLMAVSGMVRLVGPAPPTPTPTVHATIGPALTPVPTPVSTLHSANPFGPTSPP